MTSNMTPEQKKLIRLVKTIAGVSFIAAGLFILLNTEHNFVQQFLGDEQTAKIFGGAILAFGILDLILVRFFFSDRNVK